MATRNEDWGLVGDAPVIFLDFLNVTELIGQFSKANLEAAHLGREETQGVSGCALAIV